MDDTRRKLFERFDEDVHQRLRIRLADAKAQLDRVGQRFWSLTRFILADRARFDDDALAFDLEGPAEPGDIAGPLSPHLEVATRAEARRREERSRFLYRLSHPLGETCGQGGKSLARRRRPTSFSTSRTTRRACMSSRLFAGKTGLPRSDATADRFLRARGISALFRL